MMIDFFPLGFVYALLLGSWSLNGFLDGCGASVDLIFGASMDFVMSRRASMDFCFLMFVGASVKWM